MRPFINNHSHRQVLRQAVVSQRSRESLSSLWSFITLIALIALSSGCASDIGEISSPKSNEGLEERATSSSFVPPYTPLRSRDRASEEPPTGHDLSERAVIAQQLGEMSSYMTLSQIGQAQAATSINIRERTLINTLSWSGSLMEPLVAEYHSSLANPDGDLDESTHSHFVIQLFRGRERPEESPLIEVSVEAELISQSEHRVEYRWVGDLGEPLEPGTYWISIIGLGELSFYWESAMTDLTVSEDRAVAQLQGASRVWGGGWRDSSADEAELLAGFSLNVEGLIASSDAH